MELKINDSWLLISGNNDNTNYHQTPINKENAFVAQLPCYTHMYIEDHIGVSWYQKELSVDKLPEEKEIALLCFEQADFRAEVSVNGVIVGNHTGVEDPFSFDITDVLKKGDNRITVRISKPHEIDVDGYTFGEIPHRNQHPTGLQPGACYNESGIHGEVCLKYLPKTFADDIYLISNPDNGEICMELNVINKYNFTVRAGFEFNVSRSPDGSVLDEISFKSNLSVGENKVKTKLKVKQFELWDTDNPVLYNVSVNIKSNNMVHKLIKRTGFRTFEVKEDGYFYLNNKRMFLKCSHTGNCMPISTHHISPDKELLRKDFLMAKATGFNMVRFISGAALPIQLDLCDEIGLMIYEEPVSGWLTKNGPHAKENFRHDMLSMIKRDRNHPCITIWGLLNETPMDGEFADLYEAARDILPELRKIDQTRLVLFSSGRWDNLLSNGSLCNPYKDEWDFLWNGDGTDDRISECFQSMKYIGSSLVGSGIDDSKDEVGDIHFYGFIPRPPVNIEYLRTVGSKHNRPVFISEVGIGSVLDTVSLVNRFEQDGRSKIYPDVKMIYQMNDIFNSELKKYGFDKIYPLPSVLIDGSMENHAKYREFDFDILRSNPNLNGLSITGLLDHSICGEGLWTLYREFKPHIADVLQTGFSPLMWCIIPEKTSLFKNEYFETEVLISNEDKLKVGKRYPVRATIIRDGKMYDYSEYSFTVSENNSFVIPVFSDSFKTDNLPEGEYTFKLEIFGADVKGNERKFRVYNHTKSKAGKKIYCINITDDEKRLFLDFGYEIYKEFSDNSTVIVGNVTNENFYEVKRLLDNGATVISLRANENEDLTIKLLPENRQPVKHNYGDWLYHQESVVNYESTFFTGLPAGTMDVDVYGSIFTSFAFWAEDEQVPDITHSMSFCTGYPVKSGYIGGFKLGTYKLEKGTLVINSFNLIDCLSPIAEKILINIIDNA